MSNMKRMANSKAREYVQSRLPFNGSNLLGIWEPHPAGEFYVVRSYGWWPLFAYHEKMKVWYENLQHYSPTTSKHKTQAHPLHPTIVVDVRTMGEVFKIGAGAITLRKESEE